MVAATVAENRAKQGALFAAVHQHLQEHRGSSEKADVGEQDRDEGEAVAGCARHC